MTKRTKKIIEESVVVEPKKDIVAFDVFDKNGVFVRQYNFELHGDRAEEYAQRFSEKKGFTYKRV